MRIFLAAFLLMTAALSDDPDRVAAVSNEILVAGTGGSNPSIGQSPDGTVHYVAWADMTHDEANLLLVRISGGLVESQIRVNDIPGDVDFHQQASPLVSVGPEGNVYVAWQSAFPVEGRMFPASNLKFARSTDGGLSFAPSIFVNDDHNGPPTSHTFHGMAVGPDGSVYLSWIDGRRGEGKKKEGTGSTSHHGHESGHDGHGMHHAEGEMRGPDIRVARSGDLGRSFEISAIVDSVACPCCRTAIAVGPRGEVYVAWRKLYPDNIRDIALARSDDKGRSFTPPARIHADEWKIDGCPHHGPSLAVGPDGKVHAVWYTGKEGASGSVHAVSVDAGMTFHVADRIEFTPGTETTHPSLALSPEGKALVVAEEWNTSGNSVRVGECGDELSVLGGCSGTFPSIVCGKETGFIACLRSDSVLVRSFPLR